MRREPQLCALLLIAGATVSGCQATWPNYRAETGRMGQQILASKLSDPDAVPHLKVGWTFTPPDPGTKFQGSPVVFDHTVFVGSLQGVFYAIDEKTGTLRWRYPSTGSLLLTSPCPTAFGNYGIKSSATFAEIGGQDAVIFGAPDPAASPALGSAVLYAVNAASGALIWKSDVVATVNGCTTAYSTILSSPYYTELHERIAYSSPLASGGKVYVGISDSGDDPIQNGRVAAVDEATGKLVPGFSYFSVTAGNRGGGVWNGPATDGQGLYFTTGNTRFPPELEPAVNRGLSMMRVDPNTGSAAWQFQPVPYAQDDDPDWSAGAAVMYSSSGEQILSVQKDGWAYGVEASTGKCLWQYPPTNEPSCTFAPSPPNTLHNDYHYKVPGAVWGDTFITMAGGWDLVMGPSQGPTAGYTKLYSFNATAPDAFRVRWVVDVPDTAPGHGYNIGAPSVTGGIVYVTTSQGHLVAFADPLVAIPQGIVCTYDWINPASVGPTWPAFCIAGGAQVAFVPAQLVDLALPDGTSGGGPVGLRMEPAIAYGKLFVSTQGGHVYALWPQ